MPHKLLGARSARLRLRLLGPAALALIAIVGVLAWLGGALRLPVNDREHAYSPALVLQQVRRGVLRQGDLCWVRGAVLARKWRPESVPVVPWLPASWGPTRQRTVLVSDFMDEQDDQGHIPLRSIHEAGFHDVSPVRLIDDYPYIRALVRIREDRPPLIDRTPYLELVEAEALRPATP